MRRTSVVIALALLVALVGCGQKKKGGATVVARVGGRAITQADLDARLEDIPQLARPEYSGPVGRSRMLRQMVEEEVLYRAALDDHLDRDADVRRRVEQSTRQLLVQSYLDRQQARMSHVDEKELRDFYDKHRTSTAPSEW
jgi:EpsD family peptidyl-prolyl cis-trans isomerase